MKKNKPTPPPVIPAPVDVTHINLVLSKLDGLLQAQAHPPSNIDKILAIVTDNNERLIALAQNVGLLADWVNNINVRLDKQIKLLMRIEHQVEEILDILEGEQVTDFELFQDKGDTVMAIKGIQAGSNADFTISFVPPDGVALQTGPLVSPPTDSSITIGPALVNPSPVRFNAAVAAGDTNPTFDLTITGVNGAGDALTHTFGVPILPAAPVQITDFGLDQD